MSFLCGGVEVVQHLHHLMEPNIPMSFMRLCLETTEHHSIIHQFAYTYHQFPDIQLV